MILNITTDPNPILRQVGKNVESAELKNSDMQELFDNMAQTMYKADGVGIAAPQVGISKQICVIAQKYINKELQKNGDLILINPSWEKLTRWQAVEEEGCLSVPGLYGKVKRYKKIKVKALDKNGVPLEFTAENYFARICQHEIDHLNGILFIDKAKDLRPAERT